MGPLPNAKIWNGILTKSNKAYVQLKILQEIFFALEVIQSSFVNKRSYRERDPNK